MPPRTPTPAKVFDGAPDPDGQLDLGRRTAPVLVLHLRRAPSPSAHGVRPMDLRMAGRFSDPIARRTRRNDAPLVLAGARNQFSGLPPSKFTDRETT